MPRPIEVSQPGTWPETVKTFVENWAERLAGTTKLTVDLEIPFEEQVRFAEILAPETLRAYHCTRLTDAEVEAIRDDGLAGSSEELVTRKLTAVHAEGLLTEGERSLLQARNVLSETSQQTRRGQVCVLIGRNALDEDSDGIAYLLERWGGELTYWLHQHDQEMITKLQSIGRPAVAVVDVPNLLGCSQFDSPSVSKIFVAKALGLAEAYGEAALRPSVEHLRVSAIWQPGDEDYDLHPNLLRFR